MIEDDSHPVYQDQEPKFPFWLKATYILAPIWGLIFLSLYWNGNFDDWLDRGHWTELQQAARTTYDPSR